MITLDVTILSHPKDLGYTGEYEDAFSIGSQGVAAIADGVASAIFSRQWAQILTAAVTQELPEPDDQATFADWLQRARGRWGDQITSRQLNWMQRQKLQAVHGAYSTLLWVQFLSREVVTAAGQAQLPFVCRALGDCCLFHVRGDRLLRSFPLTRVEEFELDPVTLCSTNWRADSGLTFTCLCENAQDGDRLFLATDAFAKWALQTTARNESVDWAWFEQLTSEEWSKWVSTARDLSAEQRMRVDDTTLICIKVGLDLVPCESSAEAPQEAVLMPALTVQQRLVGPLAPDDAAVSVVAGGTDSSAESAREEPCQGASENLPQDQPAPMTDAQQEPVNPVAGLTHSKGIASWLRGYFHRTT